MTITKPPELTQVCLSAPSVYELIKSDNSPKGRIKTYTEITFDLEGEKGIISHYSEERITIPPYNYRNLAELKDPVDLNFIRKLLGTNDSLEQIVKSFKSLNKLKEHGLDIKISTPTLNYRKNKQRRFVTIESLKGIFHIDCY